MMMMMIDIYIEAGGGCDGDDAGGDNVDVYDDDDNDAVAAADDDDCESHSLHWLSWTSKAHAVSLVVPCYQLEMHPMQRALRQAFQKTQP